MDGEAKLKASVYTDFSQFMRLKAQARQEQDAVLPEVARQFESVFMEQMLKSMRAANKVLSAGNFLQSSAQEMYQDMYDKQMSLDLSNGKGIGLADLIVQQLRKEQAPTAATTEASKTTATQKPDAQMTHLAPVSEAKPTTPAAFDSPLSFVKALWDEATAVAASLGVDAKLLVAQAALETGWGKYIIKNEDGHSSHNLFNIKAKGQDNHTTIYKSTLEYENGEAVKRFEPFRAYNSFAESFSDYLQFVGDSNRYQKALDNAHDPQAYIHELQQAGYATDPNYANKILQIYNGETLNKAINHMENNDA